MRSAFEGVGRVWRNKQPTTLRSYRCRCGRPVFFRNSECLACRTQLGFVPGTLRLSPLSPGREPGTWYVDGDADRQASYRRCRNFDTPSGCNWLVASIEPATLCIACRLNRTIPDLSVQDSGDLWRKIELAKRRLVSQLLALGLPVKSKVAEDLEHGLMYDLLRAQPGGSAVMTGHERGLITINVEEADDARREQMRSAMREPYRTMLGNLRHEVGHYYWDRLVQHTRWLEPFRTLFGDETVDYAASLQRHYDNGPDPSWTQRCVSAYAATHPWEDWAETWAHYLHMIDTMDTALSFGIDGDDVELSYESFTMADLAAPDSAEARRFLQFVYAWVSLTAVLNELSRSMGQQDFYPFVLARPVVAKLYLVHRIIGAERGAAVRLAKAEERKDGDDDYDGSDDVDDAVHVGSPGAGEW